MSKKLVITCESDKVGNSYFAVSFEGERGETIVRYLSYPQLLKLLNASHIEEKTYVSLGQVAEGYIDSNICTDGGGSVRMYVPAKQRVMLIGIEGEKLPRAFKIPMPPMIFQIEFGGKRFSGKCCIVKGSYEEVKRKYYGNALVGYYYPFGNVSDSLTICMGNISYDVPAAIDAPKYIDAFFDGITNNDYMVESRVKSGKHQMEFLGFLEGKKMFPYKELIELPENLNKTLCCPYVAPQHNCEK